jgi:cyclin T
MVSALTDGSFRYLSKEEIERGLPSWQDDVGAGKEAQLRATYCSFICDVGLRVRL